MSSRDFYNLICKCIKTPNLETCIVGEHFDIKTNRPQYYYEFTLVYGPFQTVKKKYSRIYFRPLDEQELVNDIFNTVTSIGRPFIFDFKKAQFFKQMEIVG